MSTHEVINVCSTPNILKIIGSNAKNSTKSKEFKKCNVTFRKGLSQSLCKPPN